MASDWKERLASNNHRRFPVREGSTTRRPKRKTRYAAFVVFLLGGSVFLWRARLRLEIYSGGWRGIEKKLDDSNSGDAAVLTTTAITATTATSTTMTIVDIDGDDSPKTRGFTNETTSRTKERFGDGFAKSRGAIIERHDDSEDRRNNNNNSNHRKSNNHTHIEQQQQQHRKPLLVLHVGPHKTATSAIQCQLTFHRELLLERFSHLYIGRTYGTCRAPNGASKTVPFAPRKLISCLDRLTVTTTKNTKDDATKDDDEHRNCNHDSREWKAVDNILRRVSKMGIHVIISDEAFSRIKTKRRRHRQSNIITSYTENATTTSATGGVIDSRASSSLPHRVLHDLLSRHYRIKVVIGYRRYHEWVTSSYHHYLKSRLSKGKWPSRDHYRQGVLQGFSGDYFYFQETHPTEYLADLFGSSGFDDIVVFDLHNTNAGQSKEDLMSSFFQQTSLWVPLEENGLEGDDVDPKENHNDMSSVLEAMRTHVPENSNIGWSWKEIDIRMLAIAAHKWNLVGGANETNNTPHKKKKKKGNHHNPRFEMGEEELIKMIDVLTNKLNSTTGSMVPPLDCLTPNEEEAFLNKSIAFERRLFSLDQGQTNGDHTSLFVPRFFGRRYKDQAMEQREADHRVEFASARHCSIDIEQIRNDAEWLGFLRTLYTTTED